MKSLFKPFLGLLFVFVLALGVAACGDDDDDSASSGTSTATTETTPTTATTETTETTEEDSTLIQSDEANAGTTIKIGSKNFPEQYILGELYAQAFEAAGYTVEKKLDLGAEQVAFKTLKSGDISAYPEYTGTALTAFYKEKTDDVPRDPQEAYDDLVQKAAEDDIVALPQTPFENTYKVTSTKETAEKYGNPTTVSDVAKAAPKAKLSGFPECRQRVDCLLGLNDTYGWFPKFVSSDGQYADLDSNQAEFTMGFSTDGPLSTGKYVTYEDDKGLYPPYYVSLLMRKDAADAIGEDGQALVEKIQEPLTNEVMQELNARVSVDKQKPEDVAHDYLQQFGFIQ